ncbi:MAG TPA: DUF4142 domain-containing protein [Gemmatirosa sp.]
MTRPPIRARRIFTALLAAAAIPAGLRAATTFSGASGRPDRAPRQANTGRTGQDTTRLSDANILDKEIGGDSAEIAIARYVGQQRTSPAVRAYAMMLIDDHSHSMRETRSLARRLSITPAPPPGDTTAQETAHVLEHLRTLQGRALDTAFVQHEIADHQHDIADAHRMEAAARDPHVKTLIRQSLPVLQKHLDRARQIAT